MRVTDSDALSANAALVNVNAAPKPSATAISRRPFLPNSVIHAPFPCPNETGAVDRRLVLRVNSQNY